MLYRVSKVRKLTIVYEVDAINEGEALELVQSSEEGFEELESDENVEWEVEPAL